MDAVKINPHGQDQPHGTFPWRTIAIVVLVALLVLSFVRPVVQEESASSSKKSPIKKLQIGIKKRVENCERKSMKGDLLSIHYRVTF
jgi:hypothetical protein